MFSSLTLGRSLKIKSNLKCFGSFVIFVMTNVTCAQVEDSSSLGPIYPRKFNHATIERIWNQAEESSTKKALLFMPRLIGRPVSDALTGKVGQSVGNLAKTPYHLIKSLQHKVQKEFALSDLRKNPNFDQSLHSARRISLEKVELIKKIYEEIYDEAKLLLYGGVNYYLVGQLQILEKTLEKPLKDIGHAEKDQIESTLKLIDEYYLKYLITDIKGKKERWEKVKKFKKQIDSFKAQGDFHKTFDQSNQTLDLISETSEYYQDYFDVMENPKGKIVDQINDKVLKVFRQIRDGKINGIDLAQLKMATANSIHILEQKFNNEEKVKLGKLYNEIVEQMSREEKLSEGVEKKFQEMMDKLALTDPAAQNYLKFKKKIQTDLSRGRSCAANSVLNVPGLLFDGTSDVATILQDPLHSHHYQSDRVKICAINLVSDYYIGQYTESMSKGAKIALGITEAINPAYHIAVVVDEGSIHNVDNRFSHGRSESKKLDMNFLKCQSTYLTSDETESVAIERLNCTSSYYFPNYDFVRYNCGGHAKDLLSISGFDSTTVENMGVGSNFRCPAKHVQYQIESVKQRCDEHINFVKDLIWHLENGNAFPQELNDYFLSKFNGSLTHDVALQVILSAARGNNPENKKVVQQFITPELMKKHFDYVLKRSPKGEITILPNNKKIVRKLTRLFNETETGQQGWIKENYPEVFDVLKNNHLVD
jgi:hypothetical protein